MLAYLPPEDVEAVTNRLYRDLSESDRASRVAQLQGKLASVRHQGYAIDDEQYELGVCCVAAP